MDQKRNAYPAKLRTTAPEGIEISSAMSRLFDEWYSPDDRLNEFFTNFKYSQIDGFDKSKGISRRDASKVIYYNGLYYVYYGRRDNVKYGDYTYHSAYDFSDIYYATSKDGFTWEEQGIAISRASQGGYSDYSVSAPDVLKWDGKYYMYYQVQSSDNKDVSSISMACAQMPTGPWVKMDQPIVSPGKDGDWDDEAVYNPCVVVYKDQIWLYYRGENKGTDASGKYMVRGQGVAIATAPDKVYEKHMANPVLNSGFEPFVYPYKDGIAAVVTFDGIEKNTTQYAANGIDFEVTSFIHCPPMSAGAFTTEDFMDSGRTIGVEWGLCHVSDFPSDHYAPTFLMRFDCGLGDFKKPMMYCDPLEFYGRYSEEAYLGPNMELSLDMKEALIAQERMMIKK